MQLFVGQQLVSAPQEPFQVRTASVVLGELLPVPQAFK